MASNENRILILGAAGRDFHNFNTVYRDDPSARVVAFTATQIPGIAGRRYPAVLAGPRYPQGIPIVAEEELSRLIRDERIDTCVFSYSDVTHEHVMHLASQSIALGADFLLLSARRTMIPAKVPVIAITAVRTGAGKSQTTRYLSRILKTLGKRVVAIRHPMPYGDLADQACQRFATYADLDTRKVHDRRARGVRAAHRQRLRRLRRRGLRADPRARRRGGRRHPLGRRQQRPSLLRADAAHLHRRPASRRTRDRRTTPARRTSGAPTSSSLNKCDTAEPPGTSRPSRRRRRG